MTDSFTRRYQIWSLAGQREAAREMPARRTRADDRKKRYDSFERPGLLYPESNRLTRSRPESDDAGSSLYRYGLPIEIELLGLCTLPNGRSSICRTRKISSESADFFYGAAPGGYRPRLPDEIAAGATMQLDLDQIGKFHGALTVQNLDGFQIAVAGDCKDLLSNRLARLATVIRSTSLDDPVVAAKQTVTRLEPHTKSCCFIDHMGTLRRGSVINVSQIDALIKAAIIPPVGARIVFAGPGRYVAEIARKFEIGFAVTFCTPIPPDEFSAAIKLLDE